MPRTMTPSVRIRLTALLPSTLVGVNVAFASARHEFERSDQAIAAHFADCAVIGERPEFFLEVRSRVVANVRDQLFFFDHIDVRERGGGAAQGRRLAPPCHWPTGVA